MDIVFYILSALMVICAALVVTQRNPVTSAMLLILVFFFMAGLFVLLEAFFLAVIQVLVYAGAVMVLFLFVMMLLDIRPSVRRRFGLGAGAAGMLLGGSFLALLSLAFNRANLPDAPRAALEAGIRPIGRLLFSEYLFAFEITSLLLLSALIGVVLLSKKEAS